MMPPLQFHRHPSRRPYWQMLYMLPLYPFYKAAEAFVAWMDSQ